MGNMGQRNLGNATSTSFLHHVRDLWKSPRGTVLQIETLALVAIVLSFFLAAFGSCRRWSNNWLIQKGFLAANALFLSLGTYSIGLMQSSPVKSEMYPIWAVSLLALLCCVDTAATSGLDNKSQLWMMLYQLCLYFGYVLLMSISTISSDIGNIAICVLSAMTFIKGFHRSMALVLPSSMRNMIREVRDNVTVKGYFGDPSEERFLVVNRYLDVMTGTATGFLMDRIASTRCEDRKLESDLNACKDVCLSFSLSHFLHGRFVGSGRSIVEPTETDTDALVRNYERAFKVVETELAFLYDVLYTSNAFLHYYEAKSASIWAFASVIGICFVGAVTVIPGARTSRRGSPGTIVVDTTTADFVITGVILVSLALLQVLQLLRCWTSNWARVAFACDCARKSEHKIIKEEDVSWGMRLRACLIKINWSDKYLWQNKLGQHSLIESIRMRSLCRRLFCGFPESISDHNFSCDALNKMRTFLVRIIRKCWGLLGLQYIGQVLQEMLRGSNTGGAVELHADVKASIGDFVRQIRSAEVSGWASSMVENGQSGLREYFLDQLGCLLGDEIYVPCILMWHIATCYCKLAQQRDDEGFFKTECTDDDRAAVQKDHRVATALSKYCAYLVVSAPRLLPGRSNTIKIVYGDARGEAIYIEERLPMEKLLAMETFDLDRLLSEDESKDEYDQDEASFRIYADGVELGQGLRSKPAADRWKVLAEFWVKALVYAAPSDNVEEHMQHLSQGGELITHLWALLYHAGIHKWQLNPTRPVKMGWDYIFRIRSLEDYESLEGQGIQGEGDDQNEVWTDARRDAGQVGASSTRPPPSQGNEDFIGTQE